jgi:hypothetical protein
MGYLVIGGICDRIIADGDFCRGRPRNVMKIVGIDEAEGRVVAAAIIAFAGSIAVGQTGIVGAILSGNHLYGPIAQDRHRVA